MSNPGFQLTRDSVTIPLLSPLLPLILPPQSPNGLVRRNSLDAPSHPINNIPLELLSEIFLQCTSLSPNLSTPITLSNVCRAWRAVAVETPAMWDTITLPMPTGGLEAQDVQVVETFLRRSGARLLSIDCSLMSGVSPWDISKRHFELVDEILRVLVPHASRIRVLENAVPQYLRELRLHNLTHLEELMICEDGRVNQITYSPDESQFPVSLRILDLSGTFLDISTMKLPKNLSELYIREPVGRGQVSVQQSVNLFSALPCLTKCYLEITRAEVSFELRRLPQVALPELEVLYLKWPKTIRIGQLLDNLDVPKLQTLSLHGEFRAKIPWRGLQNLLKRNRPALSTLSLIGSGVVNSSLSESLESCPALENLTLLYFELDSTFLEDMILKSDGAGAKNILSKLEYLDLVWCTFPDFQKLVSMLQSRSGDPTNKEEGLKYFRMRTNALTPDELGQLNNCGIEYVDIQRY